MPLRILIVDDDKHICRILQTLIQRDPPLRERGVEVRVAGEGGEGLAVLGEGPVHLIISDLCMPGMDGFAFCRELRRRPGFERVPLIVSSAIYKDAITVRKLRVEVGAEFFTKPFQLAEMLAAVRRLLGIELQPAAQEPAKEERPQRAVGDEGEIGEPPLPQLLLDLFEARSSLCLQLQRGALRRRVHLLMGHVIAVESSCRGDALGAFLCERGLLTEEQLCEALSLMRTERRRLGQVLVERGWLDEATLLRAMEAQMRRRVAGILRWGRGAYRLEAPGAPNERITLQGGTASLVFQALRDTARPEDLGELRAGALTTRLCPTARAGRLREPFERVFGEGALGHLARRPLLGELLDGGDAAQAAALCRIEAMLLTGLCTQERARPAALSRPRLLRPAPRPPVRQPIGPGAVELQLHGAATPEPRPVLDPRHQQLLGDYLAADGRDHYELLGVSPGAELPAIEAAYEAAMDRLQPERYRDLDLGRDHGKISELRERYRVALQVLSSPVRRAAYDEEIARAAVEFGHRHVDAELRHRRGAQLLGEGELGPAVLLLEEAARLQPEQPDYLTLLGWARFLHARHAGADPAAAAAGALPDLERALRCDDEHGGAHACLGHIRLALGDAGRAVPHYERALQADPGRRDVRAGLQRALERLQEQPELAAEAN